MMTGNINDDSNNNTLPTSQPVPKYETLLLDMDGVLAEVSMSYRAAIERTCHLYGAQSVTQETITQWKLRGNANDDWVLSRNLILDDPNGNKEVTLEQVTETFETFYQELCQLETLIPTKQTLQELRKRSKPGIGICTGRPRKDCMKFLQQHGLEDLIDATYCMEDGPGKPDPFPVQQVCKLLNVPPSRSVVLVGDTPDDMMAAITAGCSGVGVVTPEAMTAQVAAGQPYEDAPLCCKMKEIGADMILESGFAALVDCFHE